MISVIICTYNRAESLKRTLESLAAVDAPGDLAWEIVVVDNHSGDATRAVVEDFAGASALRVRYVYESEQGLSRARNRGVRAAAGDILAFIDDDVTVDRAWLRALRDAFERTGGLGVGGKIVPVWPFPKPDWLTEQGPYRLMNVIVGFDLGAAPRDLDRPPFGANMSFARRAFERYGVFRTDLGRVGASLICNEDTEFGARLLRAGEKLFYEPRALVYHPVERRRAEKRYFQSWYFNYGRVSMRLRGVPQAACWFGVPRPLIRGLAADVARSLLSFEGRRCFFYKLRVCEILGQIVECRRLAKQRVAVGGSELGGLPR